MLPKIKVSPPLRGSSNKTKKVLPISFHICQPWNKINKTEDVCVITALCFYNLYFLKKGKQSLIFAAGDQEKGARAEKEDKREVARQSL